MQSSDLTQLFSLKILSIANIFQMVDLQHLGSSSRSVTPTSQRKSPTTDAGVQVSVDMNETGPDPRIEARNQMKQRTRDQSQMNSYQSQRRMPPTNRRQDNIRRSINFFFSFGSN